MSTPTSKITVHTIVSANLKSTWDSYTLPEHIVHWNFASDDWQCPKATNDFRIGGKYVARMEAKDGSFGFDFEATYTEIQEGKQFSYEFGGRFATIQFESIEAGTQVTVTFDAETENSLELQQNGWQSILDNFKKYTESKT
jgi:uncharacterized protein YndB with AHSA1/START domain